MPVLEIGGRGGAASPAFSNPFPVYPIASLAEIESDILSKTFETEAVRVLTTNLYEYLGCSDDGRPRQACSTAIRGDFGSGKTHLLTYARALIESKVEPGQRVILSATATELDFPDWYLQVAGGTLARLDLRSIFIDLFANSACAVAERTSLTAAHAEQIRKDSMEVFPILSQGLLSRTDIDRAFAQVIGELTPSNAVLRTALTALAWPTKSDLALKWLAGDSLGPQERDLLGIARDLNAEAEGRAVLLAVAAAAQRTGRVFVFMVDEFEHFIAVDQRAGVRRNATWFKRLLEGLSTSAPFILIAGHWQAWEQRADFGARFSEPPIDLLILSGAEVLKFIKSLAPEWAVRLTPEALASIADFGRGNIRRTLTLLYHAYAETVGTTGAIRATEIVAAGDRLRTPTAEAASTTEVLQRIGKVVAQSGGVVSREEALIGQYRFDLTLRFGTEVRLLIDVKRVTNARALAEALSNFSNAVSAVLRRNPKAEGLLIVMGAADRQALSLVDPLPGVTALLLDGPEAWTEIYSAVHAVLMEDSAAETETEPPTAAEELSALQRIAEVRHRTSDAEAGARERLRSADFGDSERGASVQRYAGEQLTGEGGDANRDRRLRVVESLLARMAPPITFLQTLFTTRQLAVPLVSLLLIAGSFISPFDPDPLKSGAEYNQGDWDTFRFFQHATVGMRICGVMIIVFGLINTLRVYVSETRERTRFQRWSYQVLEEMYVLDVPEPQLIKIRNALLDAPDAAGGYRFAIDYAKQSLPIGLRGDVPVGSHETIAS